jgi:hypothetical protein
VKHFDKNTKSRTTGGYRLLILDGHESHHSAGFELHCKEHKIITLCMPAHSSHILQPLDVGCFGPLKQAYGRQIEKKMRAGTSHISKEDFFPAFLIAFRESMTGKNIRGGFKGAGLVPLDPESVISRLDVKLRTPTPVEGSTNCLHLGCLGRHTIRWKRAHNQISSRTGSLDTKEAPRRRWCMLSISLQKAPKESCIRSPY